MDEESLIVCNKCKFVKQESYFYKNNTISGLDTTCKECRKKRVRENRRENIEKYTAYDKKRALLPHRILAMREYQKTDNGKAVSLKSSRRYRKNNPNAYKAQCIVNNSIRDGKLIGHSACEKCDSEIKIEAHHCDYTKPLDVMWLCRSCHNKWHRHNKPIYGEAINDISK